MVLYITSPQQDDLRFSGLPSGQSAGGAARTRDRRVPADLRVNSLATVPPTPPIGKCALEIVPFRLIIANNGSSFVSFSTYTLNLSTVHDILLILMTNHIGTASSFSFCFLVYCPTLTSM
ncbi:hypothetical protein PoB_001116900 [Plakobranchus ocellatus]|uniref:Uncharacterized protein n=1 Tax=Plakobranchus ocellatus TaxID=259542 RepID=A0AAV3YRH3_9GAST|nr:hypothetical protein PoB_001116900 [Plakobranchus ocellatus]